MIFVFLWFISFSMIVSRSIHVAANDIISFFLWPDSIPMCVYNRTALAVVWICLSLIIDNAKHLFMRLLALGVSLEKCLFESSAHFLIELFLLLLRCIGCLYILEIKPLLIALFPNIFSQSKNKQNN